MYRGVCVCSFYFSMYEYSVPDNGNSYVLTSVKLRLSLAFGQRYSRALRGGPRGD